MLTKTKLHRLFELLKKVSPGNRPNIILITDNHNQFLFCYRSRLSISEYAPGHGFIEGLRLDRGNMLDFFADIELVVNQILVAHLSQNAENTDHLEQLLDTVDLFSKIKLLNDWSLIDNRTKGKLICLREVRNGFAHRWNIDDINYKGRPVSSNFHQFKKDAADTFGVLVRLYNGGDININELIKKLEQTHPARRSGTPANP